MRFSSDPTGQHIIRSYTQGEIHLRDTILRSSAILSADTIIADWQPASVRELSIEDFAPVLELQPEVILLGTGELQHFPDIHLLTNILKQGIAIEVMTTYAACSTFNVLVGEQRAVVAALLLD